MRQCPHLTHTSRAGFSLVELAIVLVIIGLLVGGILGGQALIRSAELKTVVTDFSKYRSATIQFKNQYSGLPGDLADAQDYWGAANANPAACVGTASAGTTATCNGDGDGLIYPSAGSNESYRFWQHLANAGLIQGNYNGVSTGLDSGASSNKSNSPSGKITNSQWFVWNWGTSAGDSSAVFAGQYDNYLAFGANTSNTWPYSPIMTPEEAYAIDRKIDDGKPATGIVMALQWSTCTLAANQNDSTADYRLANQSVGCAIIFPRFTAR